MRKVVLDTNCLLISLSRKAAYYPVWKAFLNKEYVLCPEIAGNIIKALVTRTNTMKVDIHYHFHLISSDPDDNKFVDCAIAANATFIVSQDHHFDILRLIDFPKVGLINIDEFLTLLTGP